MVHEILNRQESVSNAYGNYSKNNMPLSFSCGGGGGGGGHNTVQLSTSENTPLKVSSFGLCTIMTLKPCLYIHGSERDHYIRMLPTVV